MQTTNNKLILVFLQIILYFNKGAYFMIMNKKKRLLSLILKKFKATIKECVELLVVTGSQLEHMLNKYSNHS